MKDELKEKIEEAFAIYMEGLKELVQIESIQTQSKDQAPFGNGPKEALVTALNLAENWGFKTTNVVNAMGYAEWINDESTEEYIGVLGHVDVVPAGTGWSYPPFNLTVQNERVYGRGVLDNKGPILASLFALKLLKDAGRKYRKNIRIIFGTNEENGSKDIPFYLNINEPPVYGFTPDSQFPAVYGEKGVLSFRYTFSLNEFSGIRKIVGDFISSSVPDKALVEFEDGTYEEFNGVRSPSNEPQLGKNVLTLLADTLKDDKRVSKELQQVFSWIAEVFYQKTFGEGLSKADLSKWEIQLTPYDFKITESECVFELSIRYSIEKTEDEVLDLIKQSSLKEANMQVIRSFPPKILDQTHPMLDVMRKVYEEVTGLDGTPIVTTGATYARFMPNIIAFGPSFPGQIGIAHNSDEYMNIDDLKKNIEIYANVLDQLLR